MQQLQQGLEGVLAVCLQACHSLRIIQGTQCCRSRCRRLCNLGCRLLQLLACQLPAPVCPNGWGTRLFLPQLLLATQSNIRASPCCGQQCSGWIGSGRHGISTTFSCCCLTLLLPPCQRRLCCRRRCCRLCLFAAVPAAAHPWRSDSWQERLGVLLQVPQSLQRVERCQFMQLCSRRRPQQQRPHPGKPGLADLRRQGRASTEGGWNRACWLMFSSLARSFNCPHRASAYLAVGSEESNRPLGRRRPAGAADAAAGAGNPLLHSVQEEQQQRRRLPSVAACCPRCCCCRGLPLPLLLLLQHGHSRLHRLLKRSQRLGRPAVLCAQAGGHALLGSLLHRPPGALRQAGGCTPA